LRLVAGPDVVAAGVAEAFLDPPQPARAAAMSTSVAVLRIVSSFEEVTLRLEPERERSAIPSPSSGA
jgi:hypothetical protein